MNGHTLCLSYWHQFLRTLLSLPLLMWLLWWVRLVLSKRERASLLRLLPLATQFILLGYIWKRERLSRLRSLRGLACSLLHRRSYSLFPSIYSSTFSLARFTIWLWTKQGSLVLERWVHGLASDLFAIVAICWQVWARYTSSQYLRPFAWSATHASCILCTTFAYAYPIGH